MIKKTLEWPFTDLSIPFLEDVSKHNLDFLVSKLSTLSRDEQNKTLLSLISGEEINIDILASSKLNKLQEKYVEWYLVYNELKICFRNLQFSLLLTAQINDNQLIPKSELIPYYYTNFMNEVYIYCKRVEKLFNLFIKLAKSFKLKDVENNILEQKETFDNAYKQIKDVRGNHVHTVRFNPPEFQQLFILEKFKKLKSYSDPDIIHELSEELFKSNQTAYIKNMKSTIEVLNTNTLLCFMNIEKSVKILIEKLK